MIGFLRAIQGMGSLDLLHRTRSAMPAIGPDGIPEIDTTRILYHGISEGGNNAQRFLPFAPEIIAATPTVGGARLGETLIHQSSDVDPRADRRLHAGAAPGRSVDRPLAVPARLRSAGRPHLPEDTSTANRCCRSPARAT